MVVSQIWHPNQFPYNSRLLDSYSSKEYSLGFDRNFDPSPIYNSYRYCWICSGYFEILQGATGEPPATITGPTCDCSSRLAASSFSLSSDGSCPASGTASTGAGAGAAEGAEEGAAATARLAEVSLVSRQIFGRSWI